MLRYLPFLPLAAILIAASRPPDIPFRKHTLDHGANEACAVADMNGDGQLDIVSGENWFEAPDWKKHEFRRIPFWNNYIDDFSDLLLDVNSDGFPDIVTVGWASKSITLWRNPGRTKRAWAPEPIDEGFPVEFAFLVDLNNDGKAQEILPQSGDKRAPLAWYELIDGKYRKHVVTGQSFGHGIGAGDVNGDGRNDILTPQGWWEAPSDPRSGAWIAHPEWESKEHLGFLHVHDVDGDGRRDIVTSHAHNYGLYWFRNEGNGKWSPEVIDEAWSQAHATTLVDLNDDGRPDLVTGKRFYAHNGKDPGGREPLGIYWYESIPAYNDPKKLEWVRHVIDYGGAAGGGMQIPVIDLDGDGDLDIVVAGKSGVYLFENLTKPARK